MHAEGYVIQDTFSLTKRTGFLWWEDTGIFSGVERAYRKGTGGLQGLCVRPIKKGHS